MSTSARAEKCPLCGRPSSAPTRPFCSQGCRDRDLLNWLGDGYRVPGPPAEEALAQSSREPLDSEG